MAPVGEVAIGGDCVARSINTIGEDAVGTNDGNDDEDDDDDIDAAPRFDEVDDDKEEDGDEAAEEEDEEEALDARRLVDDDDEAEGVELAQYTMTSEKRKKCSCFERCRPLRCRVTGPSLISLRFGEQSTKDLGKLAMLFSMCSI